MDDGRVGSPNSVALRLLGAVSLCAPESEHRLGGRKIRVVLASLGLRLNQTVPMSQLIADVWGEEHPATARNTVQVYLSGIRRALETTGHPFRLGRLPGE